ncbi:MAG: YfiR/HmsC family protein [Colwellia sp.]
MPSLIGMNLLLTQIKRSLSTVFFACLGLLFINQASAIQKLDREQVKIAYIYNFIKHINWPDEGNKKYFVVAVYNDNKLFHLVEKTLANKQVKNKLINVINIDSAKNASAIDLLYIPSQLNNSLASIAASVRSSKTLLVTDNSDDKHNAMINFSDNIGASAITFEVNKSNIIYEKLKVSAQLLLLGGTELDIASLYRETEQAMQLTRQRESALNKQLISQEYKLQMQGDKLQRESKRLTQLKMELTQSIKLVNDYQFSLKKLKTNERQQKEAMQKNVQELTSMLVQLDKVQEKYNKQVKAATKKESENQQMATLIAQNKQILQKQTQNIKKQQYELESQKETLIKKEATIFQQKTTITITVIFVTISTIALVSVFILLIKNKKTSTKLINTLTHLEKTQEQLIKSEKMASLGALIAGVAHEINTPLGIAVTSTSLIHENTEIIAKSLANKTLKQSQLKSFIDIVLESACISNKGLNRVIILLRNFKQVAADQIIEQMREINIADYIDEVMTTLANEMKKHNVNYQLRGSSKIEIITIPGAFAQVLTNLVNNSIRHGFDDKENGSITIAVEKNSADEIIITYKDDGIGMTEEVLAQIFDPFFTTKRNKGGTGLGMNIVFNIIEQKLAGKIQVDSVYEQGITCAITLPKSLQSASLKTPHIKLSTQKTEIKS